jgi:aryl-alcohol dehydrogenase-like predicted oxidoreductase
MEQRRLGTHGPLVSAVGLGCNNFGRRGSATEGIDGTAAVLEAAIANGVTFFDTADMYGGEGLSERLMGEVLDGRRDEVVIATKFGHADVTMADLPVVPKGSRAYVHAALDASMARLRTDVIDLYQLHTPDPLTPIAETIEVLEELRLAGRIRAYGASQFPAALLREAAEAASTLGAQGLVSAQDEYSLLARGVEADRLPAAVELGLGFLPFFPLANGLLTGKFTRSERPADTRIMRQRPNVAEEAPWEAMEAYADFCRRRDITMLEATFGWLLAQPGLASVIAGATTPAQVAANAAASAWVPTAEDVAEIAALFPRG